jgi:hypothetical protein
MRLALGIAFALLALPAHAVAQGGNGLYEPFPEDVRKGNAVLFVEALGLGERARVTREDLEKGRFLGSPRPVSGLRAAPSARAGLDESDAGLPAALELGLLGATLGALPLLAAARARRRVAAG